MQKFRVLFREKVNQSFYVPAMMYPVFYFLTPKLMGTYIERVQYYRHFKIYISLGMTIFFYHWANCYVWPSKSFHEIVTQPEPNGKYVRSLLAHNLPRSWSMMSKDLHTQGFNFREMNEYSEKEVMPDVTNKFDNSWY